MKTDYRDFGTATNEQVFMLLSLKAQYHENAREVNNLFKETLI